MRRLFLAAVLLCCFAASGHAQEPAKAPALPVLNEVPGLILDKNIITVPGKLVRVNAECKGAVAFELIPSGDFEVEAEIESSLKRVILAAPPAGQAILVLAVGLVDGELTRYARCYVVSTPEKPGDRPQTKQEPAPKPLPAGRLHITVIAEAVPWLASPALTKALADAGHALYLLKPGAPEIEGRKLTRFVTEAGGPPALIVQDWGGKVLLHQRLPATETDLLKLILGK